MVWRNALLTILFGDFVAHIAFLIQFVVSPADYCLTSVEAQDYIELRFVTIQLAAALLSTGVVFLGFSLTLRPVASDAALFPPLSSLGCAHTPPRMK